MNSGDKIRKYRIENKLTQKQLSEALNISLINIKQYESGRRNPKKDTLKIFADFFQIEPKKLKGFDISDFDEVEEILNDIVEECGIEIIKDYLDKRK